MYIVYTLGKGAEELLFVEYHEPLASFLSASGWLISKDYFQLLKEVLSRISDLWSSRIYCPLVFCRLRPPLAFGALFRVVGNIGRVLGVGV